MQQRLLERPERATKGTTKKDDIRMSSVCYPSGQQPMDFESIVTLLPVLCSESTGTL